GARLLKTLRCPTCLAVLSDGDATRCPFCRSRLKARRGVVLREDARITSKPTLAIERDRKARVDAEREAADKRRYTPATLARLETPHAARLPQPEADSASEPAPATAAELAPAPAPAPTVEQRPRARRRERRRDPRVVQDVGI